MLERRKNQRFPVYIGGVINFLQESGGSAECLIRNRSDGGALLIVSNANLIPDEFDLMIPQQQTTLRARTRWRGYDHLGVEFPFEEEPAAPDVGVARRFRRLQMENRRLKRRLRERTV